MSTAAPRVVVCPRDGARLVEVERNGVMIDACPTCRGIWLDRGELEKLVEAERATGVDDGFLDEVTGRHTTAERAENGAKSAKAGKGRRGGFLENFLDFGGD